MALEPASIQMAAPLRLVKWLGDRGYSVELYVYRIDDPINPDNIPIEVDEPITDLQQRQLVGLVAAYDVTDGPLCPAETSP